MAETVFEGRFKGRRAIVTGGASGIGEGIAARLAAEGAWVTVWDINAPRIEGVEGRKLDVTDPDTVAIAMEETVAAMGGLDVLVCAAGIAGPTHATWDYPVADWHRVFDLNVHGLFYCNRAAAPVMREAGYGRIVNIASIAGKEGNPMASAYSSSKAAVIGLTKSLGKELATSGVTVNCVTPAVVQTPILEQVSKEFIDYMISKIPMGRLGEIHEIAGMVAWLASEEASFCTGAVFDQSGGRATY